MPYSRFIPIKKRSIKIPDEKKREHKFYSPGGKLGTHEEASKFMEDFYKNRDKNKKEKDW